MSISATPEMFDLLSSGIYKNPIKAVVREYLANAVDESSTVDVTVPTSLVPYFKVRDYGKGMSEQFVLELFSSYGFSDKTSNNNQIGGFGIGSKSGYAYTDSFTVRSWYNGSVSTYECTKDVKGTFSISLRGRKTSDEPSGVEIIIPVKMGDFSKFRDEINYYTSYLSFFRGITFNGVDKVLDKFKKISEDLYSVNEPPPHTYTWRASEASLTVVMGGIPYTCSTSEIINVSILDALSFVIVRPIGSLNITASRESIRYSQDTVSTLKPIIEKAVKDLTKHYLDEDLKCATKWERLVYRSSLDSKIRRLLPDFSITTNHITKVSVNSAGSVKEFGPKYYWMNQVQAVFTSTIATFLLIDTDKFVPSRIKKYREDTTALNTCYIKPIKDLADAVKELDEIGVPYLRLSDFEPLKNPRSKKGTANSGPSITKNEALVVYFNHKDYSNHYYSSEEKLDLDNPGKVCYYIRGTEDEYVDWHNDHKIAKGYWIISSTNKNLSKLQASNIKHIKDVLSEWVANGGPNSEEYYQSYLNFKYTKYDRSLAHLISIDYNNQIRCKWKWVDLPSFIKDNMSKSKAHDYYQELLKKVDWINNLKVRSYDNTKDVYLAEHLNWYSFKEEVGV